MLELKNICYDIKEKGKTVSILKNVSFVLEDNVLAVITGQNGSGKSTLAKIIMGIIKPTSGKIYFNNKDITNLSLTERAKLGFAYAYQQPVTFKGLTVKKMLDLASNKTLSVVEACEILSKVGLCARDYLDREVSSKLSGGELKRIELATVIARNATINICDEPEAGIDLWSFDALTKLFKDKKHTSLVISHQSRLIEIADKVILLSCGKLEAVGSYKDVKALINSQKCNALKE